MANVSKMSAANAPEAVPGHAASPFFKVLPPEIRLNIYKKAFQGASVHATLTMVDDPSGGGGKQHLVRFRHSSHFDLLLRCRKIYDEALPTYWSEAVLTLVQRLEPHRHILVLGSLEEWDQLSEAARYKADEHSYHLCNSLPEVVKANVKHVREMKLPPLQGPFLKKHPELTPTAILSGFKSLATCDISPALLRNPDFKTDIRIMSSIQHDSKTNTEGNAETRGRFKTFWGGVWYEPKGLVRKIFGIDATGEVVFLAKQERFIRTLHIFPVTAGFQSDMIAFALGHSANMPDIPRNKVTSSWTGNDFMNLSAGIFWQVGQKQVADDEEGFDAVMRGGPEFEVAGGRTGEDDDSA